MTIFTIAIAIGLGDLGVNLAPVLASAGVVGIAVGFGAQNLVRDFLAGIFMLMEDQYGVGDVINIGDATGTVEAVSLRTTRLRDINGVVWHHPQRGAGEGRERVAGLGAGGGGRAGPARAWTCRTPARSWGRMRRPCGTSAAGAS